MLLDFTLENWMSFRDPVTFTMMPDEERQYGYQLPKLKDGFKVLPIAAIYGGNASGKSNFVNSLKFAREFIVRGTLPDQSIPVKTFKLEEEYVINPTKLNFIIAVNGRVYSYEFASTHETVVSESMHEIIGDKKNLLYKIENGSIEVSKHLQYRSDISHVFNLKRQDQLLITTVSHLTSIQFPVYSWFLDLTIIQPQDNINSESLRNDSHVREHTNEILKTLDCGVDSIDVTDNRMNKNGPDYGESQSSPSDPRLVTYHKNTHGNLKRFELHEESDGIKRLIDLIPTFIKLSRSGANSVFVIDEIERSLHTQLVYTLVNTFLTNCDCETRTQLVFTTHDVQLMDETELLRDEIWLAERNESGVSDLFSLGDFENISLVNSIRNSYLVGRYGGKPRLSLSANQLKKTGNNVESTNAKEK